jgi:long-chain acyl-CoA synthetase
VSVTFADVLHHAERTSPGRTAVVCGSHRGSYAELARRCRLLAAGLRRAGLAPGDRVAVVGANCHRYLELYLAVPAVRLVLVPLNARHTDAELRYALEDSGARMLFTDRDPAGLRTAVERVISLPDGYEELLGEAGEPEPLDAREPGDLAGLFYTGGTTGKAKGVMLTHRNLVANARHMMGCWRFEPETRWLVAAPMFHLAGTIGALATVWAGGAQVMLPAFGAAPALELIERERVTATLVVPTMLAALADEQLARPREVRSLGLLSHGGSPVATETLRRAHRAFPDSELLHVYGATETAPVAALLPREERLLDSPRARSCGQPARGVELAVVGEGGAPLPVGEVGEVLVRGDNVMTGYWRKPAETAAALSGGWYRSGDLGRLDEEGYLFLVDRAKDMIVTGGENVYSAEVEEVLYAHPAVLEAAVFGVPDPRWGEAVHAVVVTRTEVGRDELDAHCRVALAPYKVPKAIELREQPLPKSGAGKILKRELREPHWSGRGARVAGG